jgi:hypothetical protein
MPCSFLVALWIFGLLILNFHFTHISRFSNVGCMGEEIVKAVAGAGGSPKGVESAIHNFDRLYHEKEVDLFFLRVSYAA